MFYSLKKKSYGLLHTSLQSLYILFNINGAFIDVNVTPVMCIKALNTITDGAFELCAYNKPYSLLFSPEDAASMISKYNIGC